MAPPERNDPGRFTCTGHLLRQESKLGLAKRLLGDEAGLQRALEYALARETELGLLSEQVTRTGDPAWVVPLGWSHAMLVLAARPELASVRDGV